MTGPSQKARDERGSARFGLGLPPLPLLLFIVLSVSLYAQGAPCPPDSTLPSRLQEWPVTLAAVGAVITLFEQVSTLLMLAWTFRIAIPAKADAFPLTATRLPEDSFETDNVKARHVVPSQWLFRHKLRIFEFQTPLQIRGVARVKAGRLVLEGRQEWGALLFFAAFAILGAPLVGPLVFLTMVGFSVVYQRARFRDDWREVAWHFAALNEQR
jgi:hypothetical protein